MSERFVPNKDISLTCGNYSVRLSQNGELRLFNQHVEIKGVKEIKESIRIMESSIPLLRDVLAKTKAEILNVLPMHRSVGYITTASEKLENRVVLLRTEREKGKSPKYLYTTQHPLFVGNWYEADKALSEVNQQGIYAAAGFGKARFPTHRLNTHRKDELQYFAKNKESLGITVNAIHGAAIYSYNAACLKLKANTIGACDKDKSVAALYPVFQRSFPIF